MILCICPNPSVDMLYGRIPFGLASQTASGKSNGFRGGKGGKDLVDNAKRLARTCEYAALTSGADGLYLVQGESMVHAQCGVDEVYSAVGSWRLSDSGSRGGYGKKTGPKDGRQPGRCMRRSQLRSGRTGMLCRNAVELFLKKTEIN